jgi:cell division septum initiation protein DivIVA
MGSDTTFSVVRKGYDIAEVDSHLRSLRREGHLGNEELQTQVEQLEAELDEARKREEAVQITLVAATQTKQEMLVDAQNELNQAADDARTSADSIVSEAQFEAFRLVTQAKEDAEATIRAAQAEAVGIAAGPRPAEDSAAQDALAIRESVEAQERARMEEMKAEAFATIREIREEAEEVIAARDVQISALQAQIDAATEHTSSPPEPHYAARVEALMTTPAAAATATHDVPHAHQEEEPLPDTVRDDEPARVPDVALEDTDVTPLSDRPARGSFYSRRSARLPHIGSDAANGALAAVSAMRSKYREAAEEGAEEAPSDPTEDMAIQTA